MFNSKENLIHPTLLTPPTTGKKLFKTLLCITHSTHTYSDIYRLVWRDNMRRQCGEGKPGGAALLYIYILCLHLSWRHSAADIITIFLVTSANPSLSSTCSSQCVISCLLTYTLI